ncbi:MAG: flagellar hook-basal body protein [Oscillospiraceae bacterium]|nr:flagellar hook-basal body protein [Oscillospiraceae bacterium]
MSIAFYTGVAGMQAFQEQLNVTSNNIANVNTYGYKTQRVSFRDLMYTKMNTHKNYDDTGTEDGAEKSYDMVGHGVRVGSVDMLYQQSGFNTTLQTLDFAIDGSGLFAVDNNGTTEYTRNGAFDISIEGKKAYLVTDDGAYVLDGKGKHIELTMDANGMPQVDGLMDKLGMYSFKNPYGLVPTDGGRFLETTVSGQAVAAKAGDKDNTILQGVLETSSVDLGTEMVNVIQAQRSFQMNSKIVTTADEIDQMINNLR